MAETKVILSKQFTLQWRDVIRGVVIAALTSALVVIQQSIDAGNIEFNWKSIGTAAIGGGVAYILKNWLLEPPKVITTTSTNTKAVNAAERVKDAI